MSEASTQNETPETPEGEESFDTNWQQFLSHNFGDDDEVIEGESTESGNDQASTQDAGGGNDTLAAGEGNDTLTSGQDSAAAPASNDVLGGGAGGDTVDDKLLAAVLGLSDEPKPSSSDSAAPSGKETPVTTGGGSTDDEVFMPFTPTFKLQPEMVSALFESEDTEARTQALVNLLSAFGNTITQAVEMRFKDHYAPSTMRGFETYQQSVNVQRQIHDDFYGTYPELAPYKKAVTRAFEVVHQNAGDKPYSQEMRDQVGNLARRALEASGIKLTARQAQAQAQGEEKPKPKPAPKKNVPFEAGSSRPDSGGGADSGPADLVAQLSEWA